MKKKRIARGVRTEGEYERSWIVFKDLISRERKYNTKMYTMALTMPTSGRDGGGDRERGEILLFQHEKLSRVRMESWF